MVLVAAEVLSVLMRWVHITSVVVLIGGVIYARAIAAPALRALDLDERLGVWEHLTLRYRPMIYAAIAGLVVSGLYNFLIHPGHTWFYHLLLTVKLLLAAHVFAAAMLLARTPDGNPGDEARRSRRMTGIVISGLVIILIAAFLRRIF